MCAHTLLTLFHTYPQSVAQLAEAIIYGALPSTNDFTVSPSSLSTIAVNRAGSSFTGGEVTANADNPFRPDLKPKP